MAKFYIYSESLCFAFAEYSTILLRFISYLGESWSNSVSFVLNRKFPHYGSLFCSAFFRYTVDEKTSMYVGIHVCMCIYVCMQVSRYVVVPDSKSRNIPEVVIVRRWAVGVLEIWKGWDSWVKGGANRVSLQAT
jgi:hypothetical protein